MKREQRLLIGKQLREGSLSAPDSMKKCGVAYTCVCTWRRGYEESAGLERPGKGKPIKVPEGAPAPSEYEAMGKDEPIVELMRRDMEVARLRKGCSAKGGGPKKGCVTSSGSNAKRSVNCPRDGRSRRHAGRWKPTDPASANGSNGSPRRREGTGGGPTPSRFSRNATPNTRATATDG